MEKFKDWFYNYSDIFVGLLITAAAGLVIFGSVSKIMTFSDSFHVLAESGKNNNTPVIYGSASSSGIDVVQGSQTDEEGVASEGGIQTTPSGIGSGGAVTAPASTTPASTAVGNSDTSQANTTANTVRKRVTIVVPAGSAASKVAKLLQDNGLISDANDFLSVLISSKLDAKLRSGSFDIPEGSNVTEIISILTGQ